MSEKSQTTILPWTIKGIELETRLAVQKAAKKEGIALGKYCNQKLREAAHQSLKANTLPIKAEDICDEVKLQIDTLKTELTTLLRETLQTHQSAKKGFLHKIFKVDFFKE